MKCSHYPKNSTRLYRVWHGPKENFHERDYRQMELIEAYNGKEARQKVKDMYPEHSVGNPVLWKK